MTIFSKLINPKLLIGIVRRDFERKLNVELGEFDINYEPTNDVIYFVHLNEKIELESDMLKVQLKQAIKDMLTDGEKFIFLKIHILADNSATANIYYINNAGEKKFLTKKF
jgi:hypothetical protein